MVVVVIRSFKLVVVVVRARVRVRVMSSLLRFQRDFQTIHKLGLTEPRARNLLSASDSFFT